MLRRLKTVLCVRLPTRNAPLSRLTYARARPGTAEAPRDRCELTGRNASFRLRRTRPSLSPIIIKKKVWSAQGCFSCARPACYCWIQRKHVPHVPTSQAVEDLYLHCTEGSETDEALSQDQPKPAARATLCHNNTCVHTGAWRIGREYRQPSFSQTCSTLLLGLTGMARRRADTTACCSSG